MSQSAFHASVGNFLDSYDFDQNYRYLKKLIKDLKAENRATLKKEIFGEDDPGRALTKKQMKQLFRFLRRIEKHYQECRRSPIPQELEESIRARDCSEWLPWEKEAIDKADAWREGLIERKSNAREMFNTALERIRQGEDIL
jgi:hypothetical protein